MFNRWLRWLNIQSTNGVFERVKAPQQKLVDKFKTPFVWSIDFIMGYGFYPFGGSHQSLRCKVARRPLVLHSKGFPKPPPHVFPQLLLPMATANPTNVRNGLIALALNCKDASGPAIRD